MWLDLNYSRIQSYARTLLSKTVRIQRFHFQRRKKRETNGRDKNKMANWRESLNVFTQDFEHCGLCKCFRTSKFVSLNLCLTTGEASKGGRALRELRGTQFSFFESCPWYSCPWFTMVRNYQKWWLTDYLFSY